MRTDNNIVFVLVLAMTFVVTAAHIVPMSLNLCGIDISLNINLTDTAEEEEKEKEKELLEWFELEAPNGTQIVQIYYHHFEAIPPPPFLETLSPPPDFV